MRFKMSDLEFRDNRKEEGKFSIYHKKDKRIIGWIIHPEEFDRWIVYCFDTQYGYWMEAIGKFIDKLERDGVR